MAKYFLDKDINVGDKVVFVQLIGEIIKIIDKTCLISYKITNTCSEKSK